jgi:hypothetical protein
VWAIAGAFGRERVAAAGALGGEPGAALGAVLVVGRGFGLAGLALLDELSEGVEAVAKALFEGLFGCFIGHYWSPTPRYSTFMGRLFINISR